MMMQIGAETIYSMMKKPNTCCKEVVESKAEQNVKLGLCSGSSSVGPKRVMNPCERSRSRIIRLTNAVVEEDLEDDEDYELAVRELYAVAGLCGGCLEVVMPRPNLNNQTPPGLWKAFIVCDDLDAASKVKAFMHGQPYDGDRVVAEYYPEDKYAQGHLDLNLV